MCTHNHYKKKFTFFSQNIRISISSINFKDKKIRKSDFYNQNKKIFNINNVDINKILISEK